jgi:hypothetical protein
MEGGRQRAVRVLEGQGIYAMREADYWCIHVFSGWV